MSTGLARKLKSSVGFAVAETARFARRVEGRRSFLGIPAVVGPSAEGKPERDFDILLITLRIGIWFRCNQKSRPTTFYRKCRTCDIFCKLVVVFRSREVLTTWYSNSVAAPASLVNPLQQ